MGLRLSRAYIPVSSRSAGATEWYLASKENKKSKRKGIETEIKVHANMEIKTCKACSRLCHLQTANNHLRFAKHLLMYQVLRSATHRGKLLLCGSGWWCAVRRLYSFITMVLSSFRALFHSVHIYGNNRIWEVRTVGETEEICMQKKICKAHMTQKKKKPTRRQAYRRRSISAEIFGFFNGLRQHLSAMSRDLGGSSDTRQKGEHAHQTSA